MDRHPRRHRRAVRRTLRPGPVADLDAVPQRRQPFGVTGPAVPRGHRLLRVQLPVLAVPARGRLHHHRADRARRAGRALPLRRGAAAGRRRADDRRRAGPPDRRWSPLFVLLKAVAYFLDQRAPAARLQLGHRPLRRRVHRRQRAAAGQGDPGLDLDRGRGGDPGLLQRRHPQPGLGRGVAGPARHRRRSRSAASTRRSCSSSRSSRTCATRKRRTSRSTIAATRRVRAERRDRRPPTRPTRHPAASR